MRIHTTVPDVVSGYILNPERSFFSVIVPEATVNLVLDPEMRTQADYSALGSATVENVTEKTRRGPYAYKITSTGSGQGLKYLFATALTVEKHYTFSLDVFGPGSYKIYLGDATGNAVRGYKVIQTTGFWDRYSVTLFVPTGTTIRTLCIVATDARICYVAGYQLEQKEYATTYVSGSLAKPGQQTYAWLGGANRSMSYRSATELDGGRPVPLSDLGFDVMSFQEFGFNESTNYFEDFAIASGAQYQGSRSSRRTFTLLGNICSDDFKSFLAKRFKLGSYVTGGDETVTPITLLCQLYDGDAPVSEELSISAIYKSGLGGNYDNLYQEKAALVFETSDVLFEQTGNSAQILELSESLPSATGLIAINADGVVFDTASGCTAYYNHGVAIGADNNLYMACGVNIIQWNGVEWTTIRTDAQNITALATGPDGKLYYGTIVGSGETAHVKSIDLRTGTVATLGSSSFTSATFAKINVICANDFGLYIGGHFSSIVNDNGTVTTKNVVSYNIPNNTFAAMDAGLGTYASFASGGEQTVYDIVIDNGGFVWAGGLFANGSANIATTDVVNLANWNGVNWTSGGYVSPNSPVVNADLDDAAIYALAYDKQRDILYVGGHFDYYRSIGDTTSTGLGHVFSAGPASRGTYTASNHSVAYIARGDNMANGLGYNGIVSLADSTTIVSGIAVACDGRVAVVGSFDSSQHSITTIPAPGIAFWDGNSKYWLPSPLEVEPQDNDGTLFYQSTAVIYGGNCGGQASQSADFTEGVNITDPSVSFVSPGLSDSFFFDIGDAVGVTANAVSEVDNECAVGTRPTFELHGPGYIEHIENLTTGKTITIDYKYIFDGETVVIDTRQESYGMYSNTQGNLTRLISPASSFPDFTLVRGINRIVVKLTDTGVGTSAVIYWKKRYPSLDALSGDCSL